MVNPTSMRQQRELARQRETPASRTLSAIGGLTFAVGIPTAIVLTVIYGMWWLFIPIGVVLLVTGACAEAAKKPRPEA